MSGSKSEQKLFDATGQFAVASRDGRQANNVSWIQCRILLSNRRLILASGKNKKKRKTIPLQDVVSIEGRADASQSIASMADYLSLRVDGDVIVVSTSNQDEFEIAFYKALLERTVVQVKHHAVEGGVVQDASWVKGRMSVEMGCLTIALKSGSLAELELEEISEVERKRRELGGSERFVLQVSHVDEETSIETHITGSDREVKFIESFVREGEEQSEINTDLAPDEKEVLMALYSGVTPFTIPEFTGQDVDKVEETFEELIELDVVDLVRERREVALTSRGRNLASEAMSEQ